MLVVPLLLQVLLLLVPQQYPVAATAGETLLNHRQGLPGMQLAVLLLRRLVYQQPPGRMQALLLLQLPPIRCTSSQLCRCRCRREQAPLLLWVLVQP
jgi:hypothetical protein